MKRVKYFVYGILAFLILLAVSGNQIIYLLLIESDSMKPVYEQGDIVIGHSLFDEVNEGDIVVYEHPQTGINVIHRIVEINESGIQTKGDNNEVRDSVFLSQEDIKSVVYRYPIPTSKLK